MQKEYVYGEQILAARIDTFILSGQVANTTFVYSVDDWHFIAMRKAHIYMIFLEFQKLAMKYKILVGIPVLIAPLMEVIFQDAVSNILLAHKLQMKLERRENGVKIVESQNGGLRFGNEDGGTFRFTKF